MFPMGLTALHNKLKMLYSAKAEQISVDVLRVVIRNYRFSSAGLPRFGRCRSEAMAARFEATLQADMQIAENGDFVYPIVFQKEASSIAEQYWCFMASTSGVGKSICLGLVGWLRVHNSL